MHLLQMLYMYVCVSYKPLNVKNRLIQISNNTFSLLTDIELLTRLWVIKMT